MRTARASGPPSLALPLGRTAALGLETRVGVRWLRAVIERTLSGLKAVHACRSAYGRYPDRQRRTPPGASRLSILLAALALPLGRTAARGLDTRLGVRWLQAVIGARWLARHGFPVKQICTRRSVSSRFPYGLRARSKIGTWTMVARASDGSGTGCGRFIDEIRFFPSFRIVRTGPNMRSWVQISSG